MYYENFERLLKERGIKTAEVSRETGIAYSAFSDWKAGRSKPKADKLQKIAAFFGVTVEELITGAESPDNGFSDDERKILALYRKFNARGKSEALRRLTELSRLSEYTDRGKRSSSSRIG